MTTSTARDVTDVVDTPEEGCPPAADLLPVPAAGALSVTLKALADPVRLRIFHHIATSDCSSVCACHLPEVFGVSQPTMSHHLKKLVEAGLVHREMRGRWAHFTLRPEGLAALRTFLGDLP